MGLRVLYIPLILLTGCGGASPDDAACGAACLAGDLGTAPPFDVDDLAVAKDAALPAPDLTQRTPDLAPAADPLQPDTHPDDVALKDPNRPSYCMGLAPLDPRQVVDFFPDGWGYSNLAAPARSTSDDPPVELFHSIRNCNPLTGCDPGHYFPYGKDFYFYFTYDEMNQLWLQQYDQGSRLITQRRIDSPVTTASFAVAHLGLVTQYDMRRMAVMLTEQRICLETLWTTTMSDASGSQEEVFFATLSNDHTTLPARPSPQPFPSPSPTCTGPAATQAELVAWFDPGSSSVDFYFSHRVEQGKERECHRLTGCSEWRWPPAHFFSSLYIQGTSFLVRALDPGIGMFGTSRDYPLTNSEYSSSDLDIVFTATCGRASGHVITKGPHFNDLETFTAASVDKQ